jgi:hypothetical protein
MDDLHKRRLSCIQIAEYVDFPVWLCPRCALPLCLVSLAKPFDAKRNPPSVKVLVENAAISEKKSRKPSLKN